MAEIEIHNGEVRINGEVQAAPTPPPERAKGKPGPEDVEPNEIARAMAQVVALGITDKLSPMEIVNGLLQLKSPAGHKLVWTRFDVYQTFALWSKKLEGKSKL